MPTHVVTVYGTWRKTYHIEAPDLNEAQMIWESYAGKADVRVVLMEDYDLGQNEQAWAGEEDAH